MFPFIYKIRSIIKNQKGPAMQMNEYKLNEIVKLLQEQGIDNIYMTLTNHSFYGVSLYFKKK